MPSKDSSDSNMKDTLTSWNNGLLCRRASRKSNTERGIYVKHFRNIPMADMEIVLVSYFGCLSLSFNSCVLSYLLKPMI